jgi:hypothetical protein
LVLQRKKKNMTMGCSLGARASSSDSSSDASPCLLRPTVSVMVHSFCLRSFCRIEDRGFTRGLVSFRGLRGLGFELRGFEHWVVISDGCRCSSCEKALLTRWIR